jgi:hypothetical protein
VLRAREHALIPSPFVVFTFGLIVESIKELGGASQINFEHYFYINIQKKTMFFLKRLLVHEHQTSALSLELKT